MALRPELAPLLSDSDWIPNEFGLIKVEKYNAHRVSKLLMGAAVRVADQKGVAIRRLFSRHTGSAGYIISRSAAQRTLRYIGRIDVPIDHFLFNETVSPMLGPEFRPAMLIPSVVAQLPDPGGSVIAIVPPPGIATRWQRRMLSFRRARAEARLWHKQIFWTITGRARVVAVTFEPIGRE
ncbi:glycosyl transferase family protein [Thioclava atlantica]|uniref:Glycosyl transferase family protein n=1 Tax=Thioclava atlantica TaxID=1317124 RepID=A0A085U1N0_9RHOB|nr:glycosyl transferase family protein [Thioclava atlantica]